MQDYTLEVKQYESEDPRLGRNVLHDSRSKAFAVRADEAPRDVEHISYIPGLDQGNLGTCTCTAGIKSLSYLPFWESAFIRTHLEGLSAHAVQEIAIDLYRAVTRRDPFPGEWPPTDTGSNGLTVAKELKDRDLISGYQHIMSLPAALSALNNKPFTTGTEWRGDMYRPDASGRMRITGSLEGGHQYVIFKNDVAERRLWIQNSWGDGWGLNGKAWMTWSDYETLLMADGDATVLVPRNEPAPVPTPLTPGEIADRTFAAEAHQFLNKRRHFYKDFQRQVELWLFERGL